VGVRERGKSRKCGGSAGEKKREEKINSRDGYSTRTARQFKLLRGSKWGSSKIFRARGGIGGHDKDSQRKSRRVGQEG